VAKVDQQDIDDAKGNDVKYDVIVIGGGQAGLAVGYYLRRSGLQYAILDAQEGPGGAWRYGWQSLTLFSPAQWSSLPGWVMPGGTSEYPGRDALLAYMGEYERRYALPVQRPVSVSAVRHGEGV
jgi:putative flavoprotein involved in K+ transport